MTRLVHVCTPSCCPPGMGFDPAKRAWACVGTDTRSIPRDQPAMNPGFMDGGQVAQDLGQATGPRH